MDRNFYININFSNIQQGRENNFLAVCFSHSLGVYDYASIMHYSSYDFAKDFKRPVITTIDGRILQGNRIGMTECDVESVKNLSEIIY